MHQISQTILAMTALVAMAILLMPMRWLRGLFLGLFSIVLRLVALGALAIAGIAWVQQVWFQQEVLPPSGQTFVQQVGTLGGLAPVEAPWTLIVTATLVVAVILPLVSLFDGVRLFGRASPVSSDPTSEGRSSATPEGRASGDRRPIRGAAQTRAALEGISRRPKGRVAEVGD